jgi:hypothetical protein
VLEKQFTTATSLAEHRRLERIPDHKSFPLVFASPSFNAVY